MKITLDLPESLINEAMELTHTAVIIKALEELVRESKRTELKKNQGKIDLEMDLSKLRDRH